MAKEHSLCRRSAAVPDLSFSLFHKIYEEEKDQNDQYGQKGYSEDIERLIVQFSVEEP